MKNNMTNIEGETFELIQGYIDEEGTIHKDFEVVEMTGADEEAISKNEIKHNGAKILRTIIERCCVRIGNIHKSEVKRDKWIEVIQNLSVGDQDFIVLKIREISIGTIIESSYECPNPDCKCKITNEVDVDELEVLPYKGVSKIPFELPKGIKDKDGNLMKKGHLRLPNGLDREVLDGVIRKNVGRANTLMLARCITDLEGKGVYDEIIRNLTIKDRNYLLKILEEHKFGIDMTMTVVCPSCDEEFRANLNATNFI